MSQVDPLNKGSVSERAAVARELALDGEWKDMERLIDVGWGEKSTGVRLYAAAAAADIAGRRRGAYGQKSLDDIQRAQLVKWAFGNDPGANPSMLMLASSADVSVVIPRLGRILRDPRADVRLGAVTAFRRMVLSAVGPDSDLIAETVDAWLGDTRVPMDTRMDLIKLVGEAGLMAMRPYLVRLDATTEQLARVRLTALDRLDARADLATWTGIWRSDGLDVYELAREGRTDDIAVLGEKSWSGPKGSRGFKLSGGAGTVGRTRARLVWAVPMGTHEPAMAMHIGDRTWWKLDGASLVSVLDTRSSSLDNLAADATALLRDAAERVEGAAKPRAIAIAAVLSGQFADAIEVLNAPLDRKRPRVDLYFWRARAHAGAGDGAAAKADLEVFLERAKADAPHRPAAEALMAEL